MPQRSDTSICFLHTACEFVDPTRQFLVANQYRSVLMFDSNLSVSLSRRSSGRRTVNQGERCLPAPILNPRCSGPDENAQRQPLNAGSCRDLRSTSRAALGLALLSFTPSFFNTPQPDSVSKRREMERFKNTFFSVCAFLRPFFPLSEALGFTSEKNRNC